MARNQGKIGGATSHILQQLMLACADEKTAIEFMERLRWGDEVPCLHCGVIGSAYQMKDRKTGERNRRWLWRCKDCKKQFTVRTRSAFEDSPIPLHIWCYAIWKICSSKKGVSSMQIHRETGLSYKSALFMMHRIRNSMGFRYGKLDGTIEVDETYVGGRPRNVSPDNKRGSGTSKTPVIAMVARGGRVRAWPLERISMNEIQNAVRARVSSTARIVTDGLFVYAGIGADFEGGHHTVIHSDMEWARQDDWGVTHTNTVESFFSLIKRGMYGTFHSVSKKHLGLYIREFEFRYNARQLDDGERATLATRACFGIRLTYERHTAA